MYCNPTSFNHCVTDSKGMLAYLKCETLSHSCTTIPKYMNKVFENKINQKFSVPEIKQKWCTHFTYLFLLDRDVRYNCNILNLHDRSVIANITHPNITNDLAIRTLQKALDPHPEIRNALILRNDQGSHHQWNITLIHLNPIVSIYTNTMRQILSSGQSRSL